MHQMTKMLALSWGILVAIAPQTFAETKPGWGDWQPINANEELTFSSGFSNLELGGYMEFDYGCQGKAEEANTEAIYSYRLSELVEYIGTSRVEYRCTINGEPFQTHSSTAVRTDLPYPTCLKIQSDIGNGVRLRQDHDLSSAVVGTLVNGSTIYENFAPSVISTDSTGRQWLLLRQDASEAWVSIAEKEGAYVNFRLCS